MRTTRSTLWVASALLSVAIAAACSSPGHGSARGSIPSASSAGAGAAQPPSAGPDATPPANGANGANGANSAGASPAVAAAPGSAEVLPVVVAAGTVTPASTTEAVRKGAVASATFQTRPGRSCELVVQYGGATPQQRLDPVVADSSGIVSWTWQLSSNAPAGNATASVVCSGGERGEVKLTVVG